MFGASLVDNYVFAAPPVSVETRNGLLSEGQVIFRGATSNDSLTQRGVEYGTSSGVYTEALVDSAAASNDALVGIMQWGTLGSGDGQFNQPRRVHVSADGSVYVVSRFAAGIQKFDQNGTFLARLASVGSGDGQVSVPGGITTDSSNNVYVADTNNHRIQKFDASGVYLAQWGIFGSDDGQFNFPADITADTDGNLYVLDATNHRIQKFDSDGTFITKWGSQGSGDGQFNYPSDGGIVTDAVGNVYVLDSNQHRIQKFDSDGTFITKWGTFGTGNGQFSTPRDVDIDGDGNIYVVENGNRRVQQFTTDGDYLQQWSIDIGADNSPYSSIAFDSSGNMYVADGDRHRVMKPGIGASITTQTSNFTCGTQYHYRAFATNGDGTTYGPERTYTPPCVASEPTNLEVQDNNFSWGTTSVVVVGWSEPLDDGGNPIIGYRVQYKESSDSAWPAHLYTSQQQYTMYLEAGVSYDFRVAAVTDGELGAWSEALTFEAAPEPTFGTPQNVMGYAAATSVQLAWDSVYQASYYMLEFKQSSESSWEQYTGDTLYNSEASVPGLQPETLYDFRVRAVDYSQQESDWSDTFTIQTTTQQTYNITTCDELQAIAINRTTIEFGDMEGLYVLQNDIDCADTENWDWSLLLGEQAAGAYGFLPIMDFMEGGPFRGSIDGQGFTIRNLHQGNMPMLGLISMGAGVTVENLTIENFSISLVDTELMDDAVGALVGYATMASIRDVHISNLAIDVANRSDTLMLGGLVGLGSGLTIEKSSVTGGIVSEAPSTEGRFNYPYGIATDSNNDVYVADTSNNRIQKFDPSGDYLAQWGVYGSSEGELAGPRDVTVDSSDDVYVVDTINNRIQKFDANGTYLAQWGGYGSGDGQFNDLHGIVSDSDDNVYVVDTNNHRVQKFDADGTYITQWGSQGSGNGQFSYPRGVAVDSDDNVYVTSDNRIQKFDADGTYITQWSAYDDGEGGFVSLDGITTDSDDNVYVVDTSSHRIQKFDSSGTYITQWGSQGSGNGTFQNPSGIAVDSNDNVYVVDTINNRIQKFDANGTYLAQWGGYGREGDTTAVVVGGLVGAAQFSTVSESFADVTMGIHGKHMNVIGGVIGSGYQAQVQDTYANVNLEVTGQPSEGMIISGGLAGAIVGTITNSYTKGMLQLDESDAMMQVASGLIGTNGDIIGSGGGAESVAINNSFSRLQTVTNGALPAGGIVGIGLSEGGEGVTLHNVYHDATVAGTESCVGMAVDGDFNPTGEIHPCNPVNTDGSDANYFYNSDQNPPLDAWDFNAIWNTQPANTPTFIGAEPQDPTVSSEPRSLAATPTQTDISLSWQAPAFFGHTPIVQYLVQFKPSAAGEDAWESIETGSTTTSMTVEDVSPGVFYDFRIAAINAVGTSDFSGVVTSRTLVAPSAPHGLQAQMGVQHTVSLEWAAPLDDGGSTVYEYRVEYRLVGDAGWTQHSPNPAVPEASIEGLDSGELYEFRVAAVNAQGMSTYSSPLQFLTEDLTPSAPQNLTAVHVRDAEVDASALGIFGISHLSWNQVGEHPASNYIVSYREVGSSDWQVLDKPVSATTNWLVDFDIVAINDEIAEISDIIADTDYFESLPQAEQDELTERLAALQADYLWFIDLYRRGITMEFRVAAENEYGQSSFSDPVLFQWGLAPTTCMELSDVLSIAVVLVSSLDPEEVALGGIGPHVQLTQNIDCTETIGWNGGEGWISPYLVYSSLDGGGFAIENLFSAQEMNGLFGIVTNATIENLRLEQPTIASATTGGVASLATFIHESTIDNVHIVDAAITSEGSESVIGGLASGAAHSYIRNSSVSTDIDVSSSGPTVAGGLLGMTAYPQPTDWGWEPDDAATTHGNVFIDNVQVTGSINGSGVIGGMVGMAGLANDVDAPVAITNGQSTVSIESNCRLPVGGVVAMSHVPLIVDGVISSGALQCYRMDADAFDLAMVGGVLGAVFPAASLESGLVTIRDTQRSGSIGIVNGRTDDQVAPPNYRVMAGGLVGIAHLPSTLGSSAYDAATLADTLSYATSIESSSSSSSISVTYADPFGQGVVAENMVGGLVGMAAAVAISDSQTSGMIRMDSDFPSRSMAGVLAGMVGIADVLDVSGSTSEVEIDKSGEWTPGDGAMNSGFLGGIVGMVTTHVDIRQTTASGSVTDTTVGTNEAVASIGGMGGMVGMLFSTTDNEEFYTSISDSVSTGDVIGSASMGGQFPAGGIGGMVGSFVAKNVEITGSRAEGDVLNTGTMTFAAGGLVGSGMVGNISGEGDDTDGAFTISRSYATGDVGAIDDDTNAPWSTGGLIGIWMVPQGVIERSFATGNVSGFAAGGLVGSSIAGKLENSFSRGNVTAATNSVLGNIFAGGGAYEGPPMEMNGSAGGLIGQSVASEINRSYAAGIIQGPEATVIPQEFIDILQEEIDNDTSGTTYGDIDLLTQVFSYAKVGGLVGVYNYATMDVDMTSPIPAEDLNGRVQHAFSAGRIDAPNDSWKGAVVGMIAPGFGMMGYWMPMPQNDYPVSGPAILDNVHYDRALSGHGGCGNYMDYGAEDSLMDLPAPGCQAANSDGTVLGYYIDNTTNPPLDTWNFDAIWRTNVDNYPDFIGSLAVTIPPLGPAPIDDPDDPDEPNNPDGPENPGGSTPNPSGPGENNAPGPGDTNNQPGPPARQPSGSSEEDTDAMPGSDGANGISGPGGTGHTPSGREAGVTQSVLPRVIRLAWYSLLLLLLVLVSLYTYIAYLEDRRRQAQASVLRRFAAMKETRRGFVNTASHYLNTSFAKISGAVELLVSTKNIEGRVLAEVSDVTNAAKFEVTALLDAVPTSDQSSVQPETVRKTSIMFDPAFWLPMLLLVTVGILSNYMYIVAEQHKLDMLRVAIQAAYVAIGIIALWASLYYLRSMKHAHAAIARQTAKEAQLHDAQLSFIKTALGSLTAKTHKLKQYTKDPDHDLSKAPSFLSGVRDLDVLMARFTGVVSALEAKPPLASTSLHARNVVYQAASVFGDAMNEKSLRLEVNIPASLEVHAAQADIEQAIAAILKNAIEFSPEGGAIHVATSSGSDAVTISITDSGGGVPGDKFSHLFEPLHRLDVGEQFNHQGIGLDLFTAKLLVENNGGTIQAAKNIGGGLKMNIQLPR